MVERNSDLSLSRLELVFVATVPYYLSDYCMIMKPCGVGGNINSEEKPAGALPSTTVVIEGPVTSYQCQESEGQVSRSGE